MNQDSKNHFGLALDERRCSGRTRCPGHVGLQLSFPRPRGIPYRSTTVAVSYQDSPAALPLRESHAFKSHAIRPTTGDQLRAHTSTAPSREPRAGNPYIKAIWPAYGRDARPVRGLT
jgi:hypothetical protein